MNSDEAKQLLEAERKERIEQCKAEINKVLEQYKCRLDVTVILRAGQIIPQVDILPTE